MKMTKLIVISSLIIAVLLISACGSAAPSRNYAPAMPAAAAPEAPAGGMLRHSFGLAADAPVATEQHMSIATEFIEQEAMWYGESVEFDAMYMGMDLTSSRINIEFIDRMIVRSASITTETSEFSRTVNEVERIVAIYGGFIENSSQWLARMHTRTGIEEFWQASYTLRVPVDYFDMVNRDLMALGNPVDFFTSSDDVTMQFADMESRLRIRQEEERRILAMIEVTTELEELIRLETRLADLRIVLDGHQRRMTELDHLASFSTIHLSIIEVMEDDYTVIAPYVDSFGDRIAEAFGASLEFSIVLLEGFAIFVAAVILPLSVIGLLVFVVIIIVRKALRPKVVK